MSSKESAPVRAAGDVLQEVRLAEELAFEHIITEARKGLQEARARREAEKLSEKFDVSVKKSDLSPCGVEHHFAEGHIAEIEEENLKFHVERELSLETRGQGYIHSAFSADVDLHVSRIRGVAFECHRVSLKLWGFEPQDAFFVRSFVVSLLSSIISLETFSGCVTLQEGRSGDARELWERVLKLGTWEHSREELTMEYTESSN